jgi:hypothetical protein
VAVTVSGLAEPSPAGGKILPSVEPGAELEFYIRFAEVGGGSGDWLHLGSFSLGAMVEADFGGSKGGAVGVGRATAEDVSGVLGTSDAIPAHAVPAGGNRLLNRGDRGLQRSGESDQLVDQYYFEACGWRAWASRQ